MKTLKQVFESAENERLAQIYTVAAELFCEKGFDATSMSDVAEAVGITKAGIYHFVPGGKKDLLFAVMSYGMDRLETYVITPARTIMDAEERLRTIINHHVKLITSGSKTGGHNPVTIVVDEVAGLAPAHRRKIDQRKRAYLDLIRDTLKQLKEEGKLRQVDETVAAFSVLGIMLWVSRWYLPDGRLSPDQIAEEIMKIALGGLLRPQARLGRR
jgi:TetR/AcrR family transcriptional regulator, cholesterol catabolism regulator